MKRTYHPTIPPKVEHEHTAMDQSFREPVVALCDWALVNVPNIDEARKE
ncbi:transcriptional regulator, HxlR family [Ahrensia sp. R2A130]|nr:transcriptional regulator, HxlR family [Ahrensia sp. R2A130]